MKQQTDEMPVKILLYQKRKIKFWHCNTEKFKEFCKLSSPSPNLFLYGVTGYMYGNSILNPQWKFFTIETWNNIRIGRALMILSVTESANQFVCLSLQMIYYYKSFNLYGGCFSSNKFSYFHLKNCLHCSTSSRGKAFRDPLS